jgi:hypothetical protein
MIICTKCGKEVEKLCIVSLLTTERDERGILKTIPINNLCDTCVDTLLLSKEVQWVEKLFTQHKDDINLT